jgi:HEAT repeat protein
MNLMKTTLGLLTLVATSAAANDSFKQLNVTASEQSLSQHVRQADRSEQWFAYSLPAAEGTRSMCCYQHGEQSFCDLTIKQYGYGTSGDSPLTEQIHLFVQLKNGQAKRLLPVGDHCEVKANGQTVTWLSAVSEAESLDWLDDQVRTAGEDDASGGLYAISLHAGTQARDVLQELATEQHDDYSEQAVFWLGQRSDGLVALQDLFDALPVGDVRRHINFALSQHGSEQAVEWLKAIALGDRDAEQQSDAIFWLSQTDHVSDLPAFLIDLMSDSQHQEVKEKAVFSLSQIRSDEANDALEQLVKDHLDEEVREQALFWLAQNSPQRARPAAMNLLKTSVDRAQQEHAVFVLSQLPGAESAEALFAVVEGSYPRSVKKQALFWLSQSEDAAVINRLESLF